MSRVLFSDVLALCPPPRSSHKMQNIKWNHQHDFTDKTLKGETLWRIISNHFWKYMSVKYLCTA